MKILIDGISFNLKKTGGVNRYFLGILPYLKKLDKKIEIEFVIRSGIELPAASYEGIKISTINEIPISFPKTIFKPLLNPINQLINNKYWLSTNGDIFHSTYYTRHPNTNIPQVITVYDLIYEKYPQFFTGRKNKIFRQNKKEAIESANLIICISQNTKKDLLTYYQLDEEKIHVIYPGVNQIFKPITNKILKDKFLSKYKIKNPYFLYLGPRGRYKNFLKMIEAYSNWQRSNDFSIIAVGGDKFTQKEISFFSKLGLSNKIYNFGYVADQDLVLFYNCAHAFIYPSLYEGFGIPLLEAMACGTLVLASNRSAFPEVGKDSILYFNPESKEDIVQALNKSLNKSIRNKYINKGLQRVRYFSWEKTAKQTLNIYKRLNNL